MKQRRNGMRKVCGEGRKSLTLGITALRKPCLRVQRGNVSRHSDSPVSAKTRELGSVQGYLTYLKEEAKKRQIEAVKRGNVSRHSDSPVPANLPELGKDRSKESAEQAARIVGASARSIRDADYVAKRDPEPEPAPRRGNARKAP